MSLILPIREPEFPTDPEMQRWYDKALFLSNWEPEKVEYAISAVMNGHAGLPKVPPSPERNVLEGFLTRKVRRAISQRTLDEKDLANTFAEVVEEFASQLQTS